MSKYLRKEKKRIFIMIVRERDYKMEDRRQKLYQCLQECKGVLRAIIKTVAGYLKEMGLEHGV